MAFTNKVALGESREATAPDALKAAFAEFIGVFLFVFFGLGAASANFKTVPGEDVTMAGLLAIATAHGLAIAFTVASTARISGGHINPAVTFGLAIGGNITILRAALYWIGQFAGGILAAVVLKFLIVGDEGVAVHGLGAQTTWLSALILEIILTFALVFVVYATAVDPNKDAIGIIAPLAIGFTVFAAILVGAPYSGASMNPARSFGPAVVDVTFTDNWIYWVGPLVGAALASFIYDGIFLTPESSSRGEPIPRDDY